MQNLLIEKRRAGLSLVEVLVGMAIVAGIAVLIFPAYQKVVESGKQAKCIANLRAYGSAVFTYSADNQGLPRWDGNKFALQTEGSTYPNFEKWVRPYLHQEFERRLRCPKGTSAQIAKEKYSFNYNGNAALCIYYPRLVGLPVPASRVVLAAEGGGYEGFHHSVHFNMSMWGISETDAYGSDFSEAKSQKPGQYHGSSDKRGMNLFFLDGHAETVFPPGGDWRQAPVYGDKNNPEGYFYSRAQLRDL